jgi:hypothetical protein
VAFYHASGTRGLQFGGPVSAELTIRITDACVKTMTFPKNVDRWSNIGLTLLEPLVVVTLNFDGVHKTFLVDLSNCLS